MWLFHTSLFRVGLLWRSALRTAAASCLIYTSIVCVYLYVKGDFAVRVLKENKDRSPHLGSEKRCPSAFNLIGCVLKAACLFVHHTSSNGICWYIRKRCQSRERIVILNRIFSVNRLNLFENLSQRFVFESVRVVFESFSQ